MNFYCEKLQAYPDSKTMLIQWGHFDVLPKKGIEEIEMQQVRTRFESMT